MSKFKVGQTVRYMSWGVEKTDVIIRIGKRSGIIFLSGGRFLWPNQDIEIVANQ